MCQSEGVGPGPDRIGRQRLGQRRGRRGRALAFRSRKMQIPPSLCGPYGRTLWRPNRFRNLTRRGRMYPSFISDEREGPIIHLCSERGVIFPQSPFSPPSDAPTPIERARRHTRPRFCLSRASSTRRQSVPSSVLNPANGGFFFKGRPREDVTDPDFRIIFCIAVPHDGSV